MIRDIELTEDQGGLLPLAPTASDLAQFAIAIRRSWLGVPHGVLSRTTARLMLTAQQNNDGLGVFVVGPVCFVGFPIGMALLQHVHVYHGFASLDLS